MYNNAYKINKKWINRFTTYRLNAKHSAAAAEEEDLKGPSRHHWITDKLEPVNV